MHHETKKYSLNVGSSNPRSHHTNQPTNTKSRPSTSSGKEHDPLQKRSTSEQIEKAAGRTRANSVEILVERPNARSSSLPGHEYRVASMRPNAKSSSLPSHGNRVPSSNKTPYEEKNDLPHEDNEDSSRLSTLTLDCWHFFMILANIIMLAGGLIVFVLGAWMIFDNTFTGKFIGANLYLVTVYVLLGCGFFSGLLAVMGCIGAVKSAKCLILMYIILTVAILMTMVVGTLAILLCRKWVKKLTEKHMLRLLESYTVNSIIRDAWDTTQQYLHCCGVNSSADWPEGKIPASCCKDNHCIGQEDYYKAGCLEETEAYFDLNIINIAAAFSGVHLIILFGLITSCGYYKALVKYRQ